MRVFVAVAVLCGCAGPTVAPIAHRTPAPPHGERLDQLAFVAGCWREEVHGIVKEYRFCWAREADRWRGWMTTVLRKPGAQIEVVDYVIDDAPSGLVLEYELDHETARVKASRTGPNEIVFRQPDGPRGLQRGPDLSLRYVPSTDALWVAVFDVSHSFRRVTTR